MRPVGGAVRGAGRSKNALQKQLKAALAGDFAAVIGRGTSPARMSEAIFVWQISEAHRLPVCDAGSMVDGNGHTEARIG